ncbi:MAG TPA: hypothetical protein VD767_10010 [Thermomicrobiales bacterium]|nr:hypothetical protein [Thermomicrobiales bacterium]
MNYLGDVLLHVNASDTQIAHAVSAAFDVPRVTVWPMAQVTNRSADLLVQRDLQDGDFPYLLRITATPSSGIGEFSDTHFVDAVRSLAEILGQDVLTDMGVQYQDNFLIVSPAGDAIEVTVDEDGLENGRIELTPESRQRRKKLTTSGVG